MIVVPTMAILSLVEYRVYEGGLERHIPHMAIDIGKNQHHE